MDLSDTTTGSNVFRLNPHLRSTQPTPDNISSVENHLHKLRTVDDTTRSTANTDQNRCALTGLTAAQKGGGYGLAGIVLTYLLMCPQSILYTLAAASFLVFAANSILRIHGLYLILKRKTHNTQNQNTTIANADTLPVYTILIPAYREANVITGLVESLLRLNYPQNKLDIKFLLEADDTQTINAVRSACKNHCADILIVPPSQPRTKPKALNYGLRYARGSYLVVFDAEDRPHPDQLLNTLNTFANHDNKLAVVQSRLQPYNGNECWISGNFEWEYIRQFHVLLPVLSYLGWPMQLGGTSNHFKTAILRDIGGWDAYNVTEDAEIGLYLFLKGYRCAVLDCPTMEEAPVSMHAFVNQRTRWIKGHIQTWLVLMRRPAHFISTAGIIPFAGFQISFGCNILSALLFAPGTIILILNLDKSMSVGLLACWCLITCNLAMIAVEIGLCRTKTSGYLRRLTNLPFLPLYLCLQSVAAVRALWEMKTNPYKWSKTPHGLTTASPYPHT